MKINTLIKKILNEEINKDEYYVISPEELLDKLEIANYSSSYLKPKFFEGKKIYVDGDLDLSDKPIKSLGNIAYVNGTLNIQNTLISSLGETEVKSYVLDSGSKMRKIIKRKEDLVKSTSQSSKKSYKLWDLDNPNIKEDGLAANALFDFLIKEGKFQSMREEVRDVLEGKKFRLEEMQENLKVMEDSVDKFKNWKWIQELKNEIDDLDSEIQEIESEYIDLYSLHMDRKLYNKIFAFEVIGTDEEYWVGTPKNMEYAAVQEQKELLNELGDELSANLIERGLKEDELREYIKKYYEYIISSDLDAYFDTDDEVTQEMIDDEVESRVDSDMEDPSKYIKENELNMKDFVDYEKIAEYIVDVDGIGVLNSYDGTYEENVIETSSGKYIFIIIEQNS